jgi:hypothetical protein
VTECCGRDDAAFQLVYLVAQAITGGEPYTAYSPPGRRLMTQELEAEKAALVADLRAEGLEGIAALRSLPQVAFEEGRYENGWNARQILAHLAAIEWTYPRLLELAAAAPATGDPGGGQARGGMDAYNARQVEKRANASVGELLDELERNRAALVAAIETADPALLTAPIRSAGGRTGTVAQVLRDVAIAHVSGHLADILGATGTKEPAP